MTGGSTLAEWGFDLAALKSELEALREMRRRRRKSGALDAPAAVAAFEMIVEGDSAPNASDKPRPTPRPRSGDSDEDWKRKRRGSGGGGAEAPSLQTPSGSQSPLKVAASASRPAAQSPVTIKADSAGGSQAGVVKPGSFSAGGEDAKADDEFRRKKGAAGSGGGGEAPSHHRVKATAPFAKAGARISHSPERSPIAVKTALAGGSQAAVVKLASFGAGRTRAQALMNYQTDGGELAAEREDGTMLKGREEISALAAEWGAESSGREPSKDSLHFTAAFDEPLTSETVRDALHEALRGHAYAWRAETRDGQTHVHVVALAAGSHRDDNGKAERFYPNKKSIEGLRERIEDSFDRETKMEVHGWAHGVEGATRQLSRLNRAGELDTQTSTNRDLIEQAAALFERRSGKTKTSEDFNANLEIAKSWRKQMRSNEPRDFAHIIFSAKPGTDKDAFLDAARATLAKEFPGHEYLFVMHTNRQHIHVHAAVRMENDRGERLHPNIGDFRRWRETLAEQARERKIPMEATSRFDEANVPAYKLKDIRMVENGVAPESVRRRVEAVKQRAIHRPTRDEGRARASLVAREWSAVSQRVAAALPPQPADALRLYRAESHKGGAAHATVMFTSDRAGAERLAARNGGQLVYLDVSRERLGEIARAKKNPDTMFAVPARVAAERQPVPHADLHRLRDRAERAVTLFETKTKEGGQMRTAETMTTALGDMRKRLDNIAALVDSDKKETFEQHRTSIIEAAEKAIEAQKKLEAKPVEMSGDRYVAPAAIEVAPHITYERKGQEIHYSRHDDTGQRVALAFVDKGKQLDVTEWTQKETVLAALRVAASKWETINITGNEKYKETVVQLAAEHGFKITNPELQDRIEKARADIEAQRPAMREGAKEKEPVKESAPNPAEPQKPGKETAPASGEAPKEATSRQAPASFGTPSAGASPDGQEREREAENAPRQAQAQSQPHPDRTDAERVIALGQVRERLDQEAKRETQEARENKPNPVASAEAAAARNADRAADDNPRKEIPADPNQTEAVRQLRTEQTKVLDEQKRTDAEKQAQRDRENLEREKQRETERQTEKPRHHE